MLSPVSPLSPASNGAKWIALVLAASMVTGCRKAAPPTVAPPKPAVTARSAPATVVTTGSRVVRNVPLVCKRALDGLTEFIDAKDLATRLKYTQMADQIEPEMKAYYASHPAGPIEVNQIEYLRHDEYPKVDNGMHVVFVLFSAAWEYGFPVMVEVTPEGARVDWQTFAEFKEDRLNKFLADSAEESGRFHVGVHRCHYFDDGVPNLDQKECFTVTSPMGNVKGFVFVPKGSRVAASVAKTITWDKEDSFVVVDLKWRTEGKSKWVELLGVPRLNWYAGDK